MLSSRLEAVFDEFLSKVKEEFQMAKTVEVDQKKIKKNSIAPNYGYKEEKSSRLEDHPSFIFKKRNNLLPGWYSPLQSFSTELKTKYPKKFDKPEKNLTDEARAEARLENMSRRRDEENMNRRRDEFREYRDRELRKRFQAAPVPAAEPNIKKCICKNHKNDAEHIYDVPARARLSRNPQNFRAEGTSLAHSKIRNAYPSKRVTPMSAFTLTSASLTHSSN